MVQPTELDKIREKVLAYQKKMKKIAEFLVRHEATADLMIDPSEEFLQFYIDKSAMIRLNNITLLPEFDRFAVYIGLNSEKGNVTGCFLGIDKHKKILEEHRILESANGRVRVNGEDTWPPSGNRTAEGNDLRLNSPEEDVVKQLS